MNPDHETSGYRSIKLRDTAPGVEVVGAPEGIASRRERIRSGALDVLALPIVLMGPRRTVDVAGTQVPLEYWFRYWLWRTERAIEIGLGRRALAGRDPADVLEVGNTLPLADHSGLTVVDKYERGEGVINEDIMEFAPGRHYELVLSLSTLEHIGWDEVPRDPLKAAAALQAMSRLVTDGGSLLITIPVGYHPPLEEHFTGSDAPFDRVILLVKRSRLARWERRALHERRQIEYGRPYACGNALLIGLRGDPFAASASLDEGRRPTGAS